MQRVVFDFDVVSPYAYLAFERLPSALEGVSHHVEYRPLLFASLQPQLAEARGVSVRLVGVLFLGLVGLAVAGAAQVVGVLLVFSLLVGPAAAAQQEGDSGRGSRVRRVPQATGRERHSRDAGQHGGSLRVHEQGGGLGGGAECCWRRRRQRRQYCW